jgi:hypothetical protein
VAFREFGNAPINSTAGIITNPSTSTLIAELDSTNLNTIRNNQLVQVTWILGASTSVIWQLEQASSTDLSTSVDVTFVQTVSNQSAQFVLTYPISKGDRLRARVTTSILGLATAKISAEPLT